MLLTLVLLALLREPRAEGATRIVPADLGRILALDRAPEVSTIRSKLAELGRPRPGRWTNRWSASGCWKQYAGSGHQALVPRVIGNPGAAKYAKARARSRGYSDPLGDAAELTRTVGYVLETLIDDAGFTSVHSPQSRRFDSPHGTLLRLYPQWDAVEIALGRSVAPASKRKPTRSSRG